MAPCERLKNRSIIFEYGCFCELEKITNPYRYFIEILHTCSNIENLITPLKSVYNIDFEDDIKIGENNNNNSCLVLFSNCVCCKKRISFGIYIGFKSVEEINYKMINEIWNIIADNCVYLLPRKYDENKILIRNNPHCYVYYDSFNYLNPMSSYKIIDAPN